MHTHDMLHVLQQIEERLPSMLNHPFTEWQTLDLNAEPPRLERIWTRVEQFRVCLDRYHPCERAPLHRHGWPIAVHVVSGRFEMRLGSGPGDEAPSVAATLILNESSRYEMAHKEGWHAMRPLARQGLALTVQGPSWEHGALETELSASRLSDTVRDSILDAFRDRYRSLR